MTSGNPISSHASASPTTASIAAFARASGACDGASRPGRVAGRSAIVDSIGTPRGKDCREVSSGA